MSAPPNFDRLARAYRWMEAATFGPLLMQTRCAFLDAMAGRRRALILGDGDGRFTARLLAVNDAVEVDAVDASAAMLAELKRNAGAHAGRVRTHAADARLWQPPRTDYDLVVTHFFLDCMTDAETAALAARLRGACTPDALWIVSEFAIPHGAFGALVARPLVALLYAAFGVMTGLDTRRLPDHRAALENAGFTLVKTATLLHGLLRSELWRAATNSQSG